MLTVVESLTLAHVSHNLFGKNLVYWDAKCKQWRQQPLNYNYTNIYQIVEKTEADRQLMVLLTGEYLVLVGSHLEKGNFRHELRPKIKEHLDRIRLANMALCGVKSCMDQVYSCSDKNNPDLIRECAGIIHVGIHHCDLNKAWFGVKVVEVNFQDQLKKICNEAMNEYDTMIDLIDNSNLN